MCARCVSVCMCVCVCALRWDERVSDPLSLSFLFLYPLLPLSLSTLLSLSLSPSTLLPLSFYIPPPLSLSLYLSPLLSLSLSRSLSLLPLPLSPPSLSPFPSFSASYCRSQLQDGEC